MSNSIPALSVLLPFHRARTTLVECMDSIVTQTFAGLEVVSMDDGSPDGSAELICEYAARDPRLRLLRPGRVGLVAALNLGLEVARAPLVARMDADDRMEPDRLALQERYLQQHPEVDVVGSRVRLFPEEVVGRGLWAYMRW